MSATDRNVTETNDSRRTIFIVVGVVSLVLIASLVYLITRPTAGGSAQQQRLEGALRAGSAEFEQYKSRVYLEKPEATEGARAIGDIVMTLKTTVRNFTGRTINGLEIYATVVDLQNKPVKERTVVVIPSRLRTELEPNQTMEVPIVLEGMSKTDDRANIKMEVTGIRFK